MNHSINIAAKRSGLSTHVIRVWEKRYGAVAPSRTETNRREYSDEEIDRLVLLKRATEAGYKISHLAALTTDNLVELLEKDEQESQASANPTNDALFREASGDHQRFVDQALGSIRNLDARQLEEQLTQAALSLGHQGMICRVIGPLAVQIGELWRAGVITAAHEHFATAIIKVFLTNISKPFAIPETAPRIVVATPRGQLHELGAVIASAISTSSGWRATYLGPNLPAAEIAGACLQNKAQALALSIVYPDDDPDLKEELVRLRKFLPEDTAVIVGGRSAVAYTKGLKQINAHQCQSAENLAHLLDSLRSSANA